MQTSNRKTVSQQFVNNFELVADHYNLRALGQYETAKQAARADLDNAIQTFAEIANEIRTDRRLAA